MEVRVLQTTGEGFFNEVTWDKPEPTDDEIEVRAVLTGVCRSDIDMMNGGFGPLPLEMQGHEGLGIVTKVGKNIAHTQVGNIVATRGEPAYGDYYNVRANEYVTVPEIHPRYIIEPVACGLNVVRQNSEALHAKNHPRARLLIIGSGFLAWVAYTDLVLRSMHFEIDVVGRSNRDLWGDKLQDKPTGDYDVIIDLGSGDEVFTQPILRNEALVIFGVQKTVTTDFANLLWKACTVVFPSPRTKWFQESMYHAVRLIQSGKLNIDKFWTKEYNRDTEWRKAFYDGNNRPQDYSRGYIKWNINGN
jgi:threonine dehydrogenase-like Zn-dependent dehydrogenase